MTDSTSMILDKFETYSEAVGDRLARIEAAQELAETRAARRDAFGGGAGSGGQYFAPEHHRHTEAFEAWLRAPGDRRATTALIESEAAALPAERRADALTGPAGGHLVPAPVVTDIARRIVNISPIRSIARVVSVTSTQSKFPMDRAGAAGGWVGETGGRTATAEPVLDLRAPSYGTVYGLVSMTEELLVDSALDVRQWLVDSASTAIAASEGAAFVTGNGTNRPTGFLSGPTPVTTADATRASGTLQYTPGGAAAAISSVDPLVNLFWSLKAAHRQNGTWLMNSLTAATIMLLKDSQGRSLWSPALAESSPSMFMGRPVVIAEDMPAIAANTFPVAFGDFREGYLIADSMPLRITVDDNISTPGLIRFYVRRRVGGVILNSEAIKLLRVSTT